MKNKCRLDIVDLPMFRVCPLRRNFSTGSVCLLIIYFFFFLFVSPVRDHSSGGRREYEPAGIRHHHLAYWAVCTTFIVILRVRTTRAARTCYRRHRSRRHCSHRRRRTSDRPTDRRVSPSPVQYRVCAPPRVHVPYSPRSRLHCVCRRNFFFLPRKRRDISAEPRIHAHHAYDLISCAAHVADRCDSCDNIKR